MKNISKLYIEFSDLKKTPGKRLFIEKSDKREIEAYTNADWAGTIVDRRSTFGYCTYDGVVY